VKALLSFAMVVDLEPEEIPALADRVERNALAAMHASFEDQLRPLDEAEAEEFQERFQFYGVSYSVQQTVEPPVA